MSKVICERDDLVQVADAIRAKAGITGGLSFPQGFKETVEGISGGGGATFNIHYGDTEPTDTKMLWCKCDEPNNVIMKANITTEESIRSQSSTLPTAMERIRAGVVGTKIYLFGGYNGSSFNTINVFDTETENITTLSTVLPYTVFDVGIGGIRN